MMKLAMAQMAMSKDMEANFQKSYDFVRQAAGADLIFFPEVQHMPFLPQYEAAELPEKLGKKRDDYLLRPDDAYVTAFNELARQSQCMVSPNLYLQYGGQAPGYAHPVPRRGNMTGCDMKALNLSQDAMEALCVKQLKKGQAIWFACDAGAFGARKEGIWDPDSVCYEALLMYSYDDRMRAVKLKSIWQN